MFLENLQRSHNEHPKAVPDYQVNPFHVRDSYGFLASTNIIYYNLQCQQLHDSRDLYVIFFQLSYSKFIQSVLLYYVYLTIQYIIRLYCSIVENLVFLKIIIRIEI